MLTLGSVLHKNKIWICLPVPGYPKLLTLIFQNLKICFANKSYFLLKRLTNKLIVFVDCISNLPSDLLTNSDYKWPVVLNILSLITRNVPGQQS